MTGLFLSPNVCPLGVDKKVSFDIVCACQYIMHLYFYIFEIFFSDELIYCNCGIR